MTSRVLIVDDHLLSRKGIAAVLDPDPSFTVVGEATDGTEAINKTRELMPDLILMDIRMPGMDGLEATRRVKAEFPYVTIVILSVSDNPQDFFQAIKLGAQGYVLKNMQPEQWLDYLRSVVKGDAPVSSTLAAQLLSEFDTSVGLESGEEPLSKRELEVLRGVAEGLTNREIGTQLKVAETTVKNHLRNILLKLHLRNRAHLVAFAYDRGWLRPRR